jgi:WD40 repeat protein
VVSVAAKSLQLLFGKLRLALIARLAKIHFDRKRLKSSMPNFSAVNLKVMLFVGLMLVPSLARGQMQAMPAESQSAESEARETVGFDQVQPILRKRCQTCHNPEELRGDLSVTDMTALKAGSSSGPVLVAGKPRESLLFTTAAHLDEPTMPPNSRKISARELEIIRRWIEDGLVMKSGDQPAESTSNNMASTSPSGSQTEKPLSESIGDESFEQVRGLLQSTAIAAVAAQPDGSLIALAGDEQIVLLDATAREFVRAIPFPEQDITQLSFSDDGQLLLAGGGVPGLSGSVFGFRVDDGRQVFQLADENDSILGLDQSPDGQLVAFGGPSKNVKICRVADGALLHTLRKHTDWVLCTKFSHDGLLVASADRFGGLFVWETATGELFHALKGHTGPVHDIAWDIDGETLLSAGEDGQIRVWNLHHGELTAQWDGGVGAILSLDRTAAQTLVGGRNGLVKAWSMPEVCTATYDAGEQVDSVLTTGEAESCVAVDVNGRIHFLGIPGLKPAEIVKLPAREQARTELVARLERQSAAYELEMQELRRLEKEEQMKQASLVAQSAAVEAPEAVETVTQTLQTKTLPEIAASNATLIAAIEAEVDAVKRSLAEQISTRDRIERQLADLQAYFEAQSRSVENSKLQLERLEKILQLARTPASLEAVGD